MYLFQNCVIAIKINEVCSMYFECYMIYVFVDAESSRYFKTLHF